MRPEFPPSLDLLAPVLGVAGLVAAGIDAAAGAARTLLSVARIARRRRSSSAR